MFKSLVAFALFLFSIQSHAIFVDNGDGTITHTDSGLMWLQDANYSATSGYDADGRMDWTQANNWAGSLSYAGYNDWRLPKLNHVDSPCETFFCYNDELGNLFHSLGNESFWWPSLNSGSFTNIQTAPLTSGYWYADESAQDSSRAWDFWIYGGYQGTNPKSELLYGWAVREVQTAITEPGLLFALGLLMLFMARNFFF